MYSSGCGQRGVVYLSSLYSPSTTDSTTVTTVKATPEKYLMDSSFCDSSNMRTSATYVITMVT